MKRIFLSFLWLSAVATLVAGCAPVSPGANRAIIDDRSNTRNAAKQVVPEVTQAPAAPGFYNVKKGDTLLRIAQQANQNWRDLVDWNNLSNANDIKVGQSLRIVPPEGAQISAVPTDSVEVRNLNAPPAPAPAPVAGAMSNKIAPMGMKLPYSEQTLADLQRADGSTPVRSLEVIKKPSEAVTPAAIRFSWPTEGKVVKGFEQTRKGIDIAGQSGQPVTAAGDGTVLYAKNMRGYGNLLIVDHNEGLVSAYAHNKTILVKEGQIVTRGQRIAEMGDTDSETVKLHFEIRQLGKPIDPVSLLPSR
jgi:lipoprotein NlpD